LLALALTVEPAIRIGVTLMGVRYASRDQTRPPTFLPWW
jgi:hypothetical protein